MSLRFKLAGYLVCIHLAGAVAGHLLIEPWPYLLGFDLLLLLSLWICVRLIQRFRVPFDLIHTGAELIGERDFTSKFTEVGQPEMDGLVRVYNGMIDQLREERTRLQEQHFFMEKILEASPSGIVTLDFDGKVALANPSAARMLGVAEGEARGRAWKSWEPPSPAPFRTCRSATPGCCQWRASGCAAASPGSSTRGSRAPSS